MEKKTTVLLLVGLLVVAISAGLGYTAAYVHGLYRAIDADVRAHCNILLVDSLALSRSSDIKDLIEKAPFLSLYPLFKRDRISCIREDVGVMPTWMWRM